MRCVFAGLLLVFLAGGAPNPALPETQSQAEAKPKDQYFTGLVMAIDDASLTVHRTVLGKNSSTKKFVVSGETRFEGGRPQIRSQVTVRYVAAEDGDRAVHVILRRSPK